ncbi:phosphatase PAP2 family protein [Bdellovibrio sp. 22V]|uniref:phosphatase PAP2 family protein n=1 Tax=Bdellovibrio TaxID=958 RepID=UPI002542F571|nr:phosphatase PAP2 family protein [Bdellovibrio sp. 22V]WII72638.1 phosphatase PAP2 family protein [Bdellovibrio sp. 22V]
MPVQQFGELLSNPKKLTQHILKVFFCALVLAILAMLFIDQPLSAYFAEKEVKDLYWAWARILTDIGLSEYYFILALGTWAFTKWIAPLITAFKKHPNKVDYYRRWGLNFFVALLVCGAMTHIIKFLAGRQRPHKSPDFDPYVFNPFTTHWHWHSFSSGHSQVIFTAATMMSVAFPRFRWFWIPFAMLICATRVVVHDHFLSDIIMGAAVGYIGTLLALQLMRKKTKNGLYP